MHSLPNLRVIAPLFSSIEEDFRKFTSNFKVAFWQIGTAILEKARKGTIFASDAIIADSDNEDDNFDTLLSTAGAIYILKPLLRTSIIDAMMPSIRPHCLSMMKNTALSIYHQENSQIPIGGKAETNAVRGELGDDLPDWTPKVKATDERENKPETTQHQDAEEQCPLAGETNKPEENEKTARMGVKILAEVNPNAQMRSIRRHPERPKGALKGPNPDLIKSSSNG